MRIFLHILIIMKLNQKLNNYCLENNNHKIGSILTHVGPTRNKKTTTYMINSTAGL